MKTRQGAPRPTAVEPQESTRTTDYRSTTDAAAHHYKAREAILYHLLALPFALAAIVAACALLLLVWP